MKKKNKQTNVQQKLKTPYETDKSLTEKDQKSP